MIGRPSKPADWQRPDDYDPPGADWMDCTTVGSAFEMQVDLTRPAHYRHRLVSDLGTWREGMVTP